MSLFGGDSAASQDLSSSTSQSDEEVIPTSAQKSTTSSKDKALDTRNSVDNLNAADPSSNAEIGVSSTSTSESQDSDSSSSGPALQDRPNRLTAENFNWRHWTHSERSLVNSLNQIRANDLSIHLYNTHALKVHLRTEERLAQSKPWSAKFRWMDLTEEQPEGKPRKRKWHPKDAWTAWPVEPERVPRAEEVWGMPGDDKHEAFTLKKEEQGKASDELEQILTGVVMRQAREQWDARERADEDEDRADEDDNPGRMEEQSEDTGIAYPSPPEKSEFSRSRSRSPRRTFSNQDSQPEIHGTGTSNESDVVRDSTEDHLSRPVFMANEERERHVLKPMVRSLLADLDELLGALRYTTHRRLLHPEAIVYRIKGPAARNPTSEDHGEARDKQTQTGRQASTLKDQFIKPPKSKENNRGQHESGAEEALDQGDTMTDSETSLTDGITSDSEMSSDSSDGMPLADGTTFSKRSGNVKSLRRLGLRDWSEILNTAATTGWDRHVIHRAAQRCSALFGESMSFRVLKEKDLEKPVSGPIQYTPSIIPPLPKSDNDNLEAVRWDGVSMFCPFPKCAASRNLNQYLDFNNFKTHMREYHDFDPYKEKKEKRVGAVHNDGFLLPIMKPPDMRGGLNRHLKSRVGATSRDHNKGKQKGGKRANAGRKRKLPTEFEEEPEDAKRTQHQRSESSPRTLKSTEPVERKPKGQRGGKRLGVGRKKKVVAAPAEEQTEAKRNEEGGSGTLDETEM